jgi:hypothetical protein
MKHLKNLMLSRPYFSRISDQSLVTTDRGKDYTDIIISTRDEKGSYALIYLPNNKKVTISLKSIKGAKKNVWWFDPRSGEVFPSKSVSGNGSKTFLPPKEGRDWVLVIDDASKNFSKPGSR